MKLRILLAGLLLISLRCATTSPAGEIEQRTNAYAHAVQHEPPHVIASFYAPDGALVLPGMEPIVGPGRVEAFLKPLAANADVASCEMHTTSLRVDGDTAHQQGTYSQVAGEKGKPGKLYHGTFVADWRKDEGKWLFARLEMRPEQ
jgi:uncharacterized protein (TIGR02246 family)